MKFGNHSALTTMTSVEEPDLKRLARPKTKSSCVYMPSLSDDVG